MSDLVGNPEDRFSHNEAHFISVEDTYPADKATRMNSSIKRALLIMMMIFGFISLLSYYRHISYSTEKPMIIETRNKKLQN